MLMAGEQPARQKQKISMDVEALVRWAYVDELSKRQSSSAEGIWRHIEDYSNHGGIDNGHGAAQRYAHFGLPDADAERVEVAISALGETVIDWSRHFDEIAGDLAGLVSINDLSPRFNSQARRNVGWGKAGNKALKAFFGADDARQAHDRPRDILMVQGIKTGVLVTMHAVKGTRPDWNDEHPECRMTPSHGRGGSIAAVVGECRGKNLYTTGSYCPLVWTPSPLDIVISRADYFAWHAGLTRLSQSLCLERFEVLPPKAPPFPWSFSDEPVSRIIPVFPNGRNDVKEWGTLPLKPERPRAGPPRRRQRDEKYTTPEV